MTGAQRSRTRLKWLVEIMERYPAPESPELLEVPGEILAGTQPVPRYATVAKSKTGPDFRVSLAETAVEALGILALTADADWQPHALFDLTSGTSHELCLRVSMSLRMNPIIARGANQILPHEAHLGTGVAAKG